MITINNLSTDQATTDSMLAVGCITHNLPGVTSTVGLNLTELTTEQQTVYADFFALGDGRAWVNINNYDCVIGIDHITSEILISDTLDLDYAIMSAEDKAKVDAFKEMLEDIANPE